MQRREGEKQEKEEMQDISSNNQEDQCEISRKRIRRTPSPYKDSDRIYQECSVLLNRGCSIIVRFG